MRLHVGTHIKSACLLPLGSPSSLQYTLHGLTRDGPQRAPDKSGNSQGQRPLGGHQLAFWCAGQEHRLGRLSGHSTQVLAQKGL